MPRVGLTPERHPPDDDSSSAFDKRLLSGGWGGAADGVRESPDPLMAFESEGGQTVAFTPSELVAEPIERDGRPAPWIPAPLPAEVKLRSSIVTPRRVVLCVLAVALGTAGAMYFGPESTGTTPPAAASAEGRAVISSSPPGALVFINGEPRGATPIDLAIPTGIHTLQLQHGSAVRTLPLEISSNRVSSQYIELPSATSPAVPTSPAPAPPERATPPPPRPAAAQTTARANVTPRPAPPVSAASSGTRAGAPAAAPAAAEGLIAITLPFPVQVLENGRSLGTTGGGPLRLSAGLHSLELVNTSYEFRTTLAVNVAAGRTTTTPVTLPTGLLSVNASPWAEVFVDGKTIGLTPLANVPVPVGPHEILWRHPELGERRQTVAITARSPVRRSADFRR